MGARKRPLLSRCELYMAQHLLVLGTFVPIRLNQIGMETGMESGHLEVGFHPFLHRHGNPAPR